MTAPHRSDLTDIHPGDWVERRLPVSWQPYIRLARLDRPVGAWLTLLPCLAALVQATGGFPTVRHLLIFSLGALLMRSAGSTINDIADRNFDAYVERTRFRPLASKRITTRQALIFLGFELALAACLLPFLRPLTQLVAIAVVPLVALYPFCKRFTHWPQLVLGAAFNWGMLMAWAEVAGHIPLPAVLMWMGAIAWQIGYDTVYAYVDVDDDLKLGLKSTAALFGSRGKWFVGLFYILTVIAWATGGWMMGMSAAYGIGISAIAAHLAWQVRWLDLQRPGLSFQLFLSNVLTGILLVLSALAGVWVCRSLI